jgi:translation elongation factor P/translation initiation factor 5A
MQRKKQAVQTRNEPMKKAILNMAAMMTPAVLLAWTSCSSTPQSAQVHQNTVVNVQPGVPGGVAVETYKSTATVIAIDASKRLVTVVSPNGATATFKAGPDVINFDQIRIGDQIQATLTKELVVFLRKPGELPADGGAAAIALTPQGAKPGVVMADTVEVTAKVTAVDLERHEATLLFPNGASKTVPVRPDVDLTKAKLGEEVVIRTTQSVALLVEKP